MARTPSNMVELGSIAPDFNLINTVDDKFISSDDCFSKKGTLIMFICNHCPFVIHVINEIIKIYELIGLIIITLGLIILDGRIINFIKNKFI